MRWGAAVLVAVGLVVSGYLLGQQAAPVSQATPIDPGPVTAVVQRRHLQDTVGLEGDVLTSGEPFDVANRTAAIPSVVTRIPPHRGAVLEPGDVLAEISGRPVVVFEGTTPAFRDITSAIAGDDVQQLEENLAALGLLGRQPGPVFDGATVEAVRAFYDVLGYSPPPDGVMPLSEYAFVPDGDWVVLDSDQRVGQAASDQLLRLGTAVPALHATAGAQQAARLREGMRATLTTLSGIRQARVTSIDVAPVDSDVEGTATVVLAPESPLPATDVGGPGRAEVVVTETSSEALVVPLTALHRAGGTDAVQVHEPMGSSRSVPVLVDLVAAGSAAVTPLEEGALEAGIEVIIGG